jgi:threonine/homoserine/homoserine lactone efflux protein
MSFVEAWPFGVAGVTLGFAAGLAPGPMTALVLSETLRHGRAAGFRVSFAPLVTDAPIVAVALLVLAQLARAEPVLGAISLLGAGFVGGLGIQGLRFRGAESDPSTGTPRSLRKGVVTNFLNPHPYLFWFTVGAPMTVRAWEKDAAAAIGFVGMFYVFLIGTKVVLALLADRSRRVLSGRGYVWANRVLGGVLLFVAIILLRDGLQFLGWIG